MLIGVHHKIIDKARWQKIVRTLIVRFPKGAKLVMYAPSPDLTEANCLWEADSVKTIKTFLEGAFEDCSSNEYFGICS